MRVAPVLLPHLAGRPVTFTRWPDGVEGQTFFEKNSARHAPEWVRRVTIPSPGSSTGRETLDMVVLESVADLAWAANLAALELHVPQWQVDDDGVPQLPDLLVLDLDPGPDTGLAECCAVAERLGARLEADGLDPVVKTSGSKGMQVYAPIECADREHPSRYAKALAQELSDETPDDVVWRMEKVLRPGKVLIDWSQNNPAKTTVAPYSLRARARATVSTPIGWDEVDAVREGADPATLRFRTDDVLARVEEYGDLFDVAGARRAPAARGLSERRSAAGSRPDRCWEDSATMSDARLRRRRARLVVRCPDRPGIVAVLSGLMAEVGANITDSQQHSSDPYGGTFFLRLEFHLAGLAERRAELEQRLTALAGEWGMTWRLVDAVAPPDARRLRQPDRPRAAGADLPGARRRPARRDRLRRLQPPRPGAGRGRRGHPVPPRAGHRRTTKAEAEAAALELVGDVDLVVLARYMQIVSPEFCARFPERLINIHHSFLPAFVGANPYQAAHDRGVKLIGATAHYVTAELDAGPIIEQEVARVDHRATVEDMRRVGRYVERQVLAQAVTWHVEDRVIVDGEKTIVFA